MIAHTLGVARPTRTPPSNANDAAIASRDDMPACAVVSVIGSSVPSDREPKTSAPAMKQAASSVTASPGPKPFRPPRPQSRYSPAATASCTGMCRRSYRARYTANAMTGVMTVESERRNATDVAAVSFRAMLLRMYVSAMHTPGSSQSRGRADRRPRTTRRPNSSISARNAIEYRTASSENTGITA